MVPIGGRDGYAAQAGLWNPEPEQSEDDGGHRATTARTVAGGATNRESLSCSSRCTWLPSAGDPSRSPRRELAIDGTR